MDYPEFCEQFVATKFPGTAIAVMAGSTARGTRTASSDIDLLLIGDDVFTDERSSLAATYQEAGEIIEVFAYTRAAYDDWAGRGIAQYRPTIVHMLDEGVEIRGGAALASLRKTWRDVLTAGPEVPEHEVDLRRYVITDMLDDLRDATDALERHTLASVLFVKTAELILLTHRRWIGAGKYLPRRLREFSAERADRLAGPLLTSDFEAFSEAISQELDAAGGPVQAGFIR